MSKLVCCFRWTDRHVEIESSVDALEGRKQVGEIDPGRCFIIHVAGHGRRLAREGLCHIAFLSIVTYTHMEFTDKAGRFSRYNPTLTQISNPRYIDRAESRTRRPVLGPLHIFLENPLVACN